MYLCQVFYHENYIPLKMSDSLKYEKRGVSASKEEVHQAIKHLDKGLYPNAFCKILPDYIAGNDQ